MNTAKPWITGAAFSVVMAAVYVICALAVVVFPDATLALFNSWAHGIDLTLIKRPLARPLSDWLSGLASAVFAGFLAGSLFGWARNVFARIGAQAHRASLPSC
jgi:hypothetical protein